MKGKGKSDDKVKEKDLAADPDAKNNLLLLSPEGPPQARLQGIRERQGRERRRPSTWIDTWGCCGAFRNAVSGEHGRVRRLDPRSQRQRTRKDGGINRASDGGQWCCGFSLSAQKCV